MPTYIYVLKLEKNKYYIGKINEIDPSQHQWSIKYKPIVLVELFLSNEKNDELRIIDRYIDIVGKNNVLLY